MLYIGILEILSEHKYGQNEKHMHPIETEEVTVIKMYIIYQKSLKTKMYIIHQNGGNSCSGIGRV